MSERIPRSPDGPTLPTWLLEELSTLFGDELRLQWSTEHGHWLLQHRNLDTHHEWWTFSSWKHEMMDRRLIDTLLKWDTRRTTEQDRMLERIGWEMQDADKVAAITAGCDHEKPAYELEKVVNDYCSYPVKVRPQPGADLRLVEPSAAEVAAITLLDTPGGSN